MTQSHKSQIDIRAPARRVFELLSDPQLLMRGFPMIERVEHEPSGPLRRGTRMRFFAAAAEGEKPAQGEVEVTEFSPPRVIEFTGSMSLRRGRDRAASRYEVEQFGTVSRLTVTSRIDLDRWYMRLLWPILRMTIEWAAQRQLKELKAAAERT